MPVPYTLGIWQVHPGREDAFVEAWTEFAEWTTANVAGASWGRLLRDRDDPSRFVSLGPWDSLEAIERWRQLDGWRERVGAIRELLAGFEPVTLDLVAERGVG